ncbi:MAG: DUF975 family protein [Clostridiales Family XIII bacterium]|jgi:uncharacterized membrane protein|nr:DUF975 family protein [Clostridiales Family XIII bacterium]
MNYQKFIISDPSARLRAAAMDGLRDRIGGAMLVGFVYLVALNLPANIISYMTGLMASDASKSFAVSFIRGDLSPEAYTQLTLKPLAILGVYQLLVTGALSLGAATCYLRYRRRQQCGVDVVFMGFNHFGRATLLFLFESIFVFLWSLLFVIPGIVAVYRYKFAYMILADNPKISPLEAIRISKHLTYGNKSKLFWLDLSFIGWNILASLAATIIGGIASNIISSLGSGQSVDVAVGAFYCIITSLCTGLVTVYTGTAEAVLYERAGGLIRVEGDRLGSYGPYRGPDPGPR